MSRTRTPSGNEDTTTKRCKRCGFPVKTDRDKTGPGSGVRYSALTDAASPDGPGQITKFDPSTGLSTTEWTRPYNSVVFAGCAFCGSKNFLN